MLTATPTLDPPAQNSEYGAAGSRRHPTVRILMVALVSEPPVPGVVLPTSLFLARRKEIGEFFLKHKLPSIFGFEEHVHDGGLMSYGADL
jgi:hypothetical protein